jgi:cystathionine beta-lyase
MTQEAVRPARAAHVFDDLTIDTIRRRDTEKWSEYPNDVLAAWVAEMDFPLVTELRLALHEAVDCGCTGYSAEPGQARLAAACASWIEASFGNTVEPRRIGIIPDVLRGVELAISTFSRPGSPVVVMTPAYPPFFDIARHCAGQVIETPMARLNETWIIDLDAVEAALKAGAGTVILCNPHNPLGHVYSHDELTALSKLVETYGARVVVDEIHAPLVFAPAKHLQYAALSDVAAGHSVTLVSASKGWNIPGLKCAQIILSNDTDLARWEKLSWIETHGASILGILANTVAYEAGQASLRHVLDYLDGNRRVLAELLAQHLPAVRYMIPEATYLAWLDCRALDLDQPARFFLKYARVAVNDGAKFGDAGQGFVRLNFATSRPILTEIVRAMAAAIRDR